MITNVLEYLENSAIRFPLKPAIQDPSFRFSYQETVLSAKAIGSALLSFHARKMPAAVLIDRDALSVLAFFGIVYSGNFYIPIDKKLPPERIRLILSAMNPFCVLGKEEDFTSLSQVLEGYPLLSIPEAMKHPISQEELSLIRETHLDTDPLYTIFTSGSTGIPKGVCIAHRSLIDLVEQFQAVFHFEPDEVFANQAPFDFDVSVKDIYNTIRNGCTLEILPQSMFVMPKKLLAYLKERKVTTLIWAVSALSVLATLKILDKEPPSTLRKIMFSGEVMPMKVLNYWRSHLPYVMYVNLYGPTEITCNCTYYIVDREYADTEVLPIGKPFPNTEILLLDECLHPTPSGETGEICVRGSSLALGYYNNPENTRSAFIQNPLNSAYPELIYRTGDLGRYGNDGLLYFASRRDAQIKHMGHRIELGEIETILHSFSYIENCCCLYDHEAQKIVLFYQSKENRDPMILKDLQQYLPKYMCPNRLIRFDQIPMSKHGKVDRALLKKNYLKEGRP
jgi:D-alanine--poly(phosphoribitol) ligase subunit 1